MIDRGKKVYDGSLYSLKQKYGQMRELNFEAADEASLRALDYAGIFTANGLSEGDLTVESEGSMVKVGFNTEKISVEQMLNYTLGKVHVKDINVKDADIEEIIRRLYKSGVEEEKDE
jgi:ABC-2 type transport system ATP-binding protein